MIILSWLLTPLFILVFAFLFLFFHPIFLLTHAIGKTIYRKTVEISNLALLLDLQLIGTRFKIINHLKDLPIENIRPIVFVSNHQSLFDIPLLLWHLREFQPRFIAKKELGKGLPSISHALRNLDMCLIDRSNRTAALEQIRNFSRALPKEQSSILIFPEGTRARDGKLKKFKEAGLRVILEELPNALVVPVTINGSWKLTHKNMLPVPFGTVVTLTIGLPIEYSHETLKNIPEIAHKCIEKTLNS